MKSKLTEWKQQVAEKYGTAPRYIYPSNSFSAWGSENTRQKLAEVKSPFGGWYKVFSSKTNSKE